MGPFRPGATQEGNLTVCPELRGMARHEPEWICLFCRVHGRKPGRNIQIPNHTNSQHVNFFATNGRAEGPPHA